LVCRLLQAGKSFLKMSESIVPMEDIIFKFALQNAVRYGGKAQQGNVIPKVLGEDPSLKNDMKNLVQKIKQIVDKVNAMSLEEQTEKLKEIAPEMLEKKEKPKEELAPLEGVGPEGVTMRFAPSPSGPMHIGHAMTGGLTSLYVKKYGGKFILRIEDTNSDNIDPEAYHLLPSDGEWIFGNVTEVWVQSDRMQIYYDYALRFLKMGAVYVCTCPI